MARKSAAWRNGCEDHFNGSRDCKASGSTLSEVLLFVASSDKMHYHDQLSMLGRSYKQQINLVRIQP